MVCDSVAQQNHINVMVKRLFLLNPCSLLFQHVSNESLLHFGHGDATSLGTGRVKCFTWPHSVHFQPSERCSCASPSNVSARCASSRIVSRIALSGVSDSATVSIPVVEVCELAYATDVPKDGVKRLSRSHEHV